MFALGVQKSYVFYDLIILINVAIGQPDRATAFSF